MHCSLTPQRFQFSATAAAAASAAAAAAVAAAFSAAAGAAPGVLRLVRRVHLELLLDHPRLLGVVLPTRRQLLPLRLMKLAPSSSDAWSTLPDRDWRR